MNKNIISIITLIVFIGFTFSCINHTTTRVRIKNIDLWAGKDVSIINVYTTSGDLYEFSKKQPAVIFDYEIVGTAIDESTGEEKEVSIPLAEAEVIWVKKTDRNRSLLKSFAVMGGLAIATVAALLASDPSCPFIYSFDGENYILDAEPYAGAVCRGLKRTEWCTLNHMKDINGQYRVLLTNELDETEYVDQLKLLAVDHPRDVRVVPDALGKIHTVANPTAPVRAYDHEGNDLSTVVAQNDRRVWVSRDDAPDPTDWETLKEELIFEFPKPENAARARVLFNGGSTLLGSKTLKYYLKLYGEELPAWYDRVKNIGPDFFKIVNTALREELYSLQLRVETENGWETRGMVLGGPSVISKEKLYTIDLAGVSGDTLKIKLTPPAGFWKIDYFAVDYSEERPVHITELKAAKATFNDKEKENTTSILAESDDNYLVMPNTGDMVELVFQAPPLTPGLDRTVIVEVGGYYEMHLNADGEPRRDILERIHSEPGFILQYGLKEYNRWEKQTLERIRH